MSGQAHLKQQDFNYIIDKGTLINLETNLPVQFFSIKNVPNVISNGSNGGFANIGGMKRITTDRGRYLDMAAPGRVHHFMSFVDLLYWERYTILKEMHEIS